MTILLPSGAKASANQPATNQPEAASPADGGTRQATTNCIAGQIAVVFGVAGGFSQPAGVPLSYQARVVDDCANPVTTAKVILSFSDGEPSLMATLDNPLTGNYRLRGIPRRLVL
jgi:hypothetical protein